MSNTSRLRPGYHNVLRREILELIPTSAKTILDLGCGTGELGKHLKHRQHCTVSGIELNKEAAEIATKRLDEVWQDNLNRFDPSILQRKFDCIIFADILEHLVYPWVVLQKFAAILAPGGSIIASIPNLAHPWIISQLQKGLFRYEPAGILDITHLRFFTQSTIFQLFCKVGLKVSGFRPYPSKENPVQFHVVATKPNLKFQEFLATILILSFNTLHYTRAAIESIKKYTRTPHKILVIDNGSSDGTVGYLREDTEILHIENCCNLGFARGFNVGLETVSTPYYVLSNSDVIVTQDWLNKMIDHINIDPSTLCLGPRSNYVSGPQMVQNVPYKNLEQMHNFAKTFGKDTFEKISFFQRIVFFFTLFKLEALQKIGCLDERFGLGNFEDDDYCLRILGSGHKCAYDNTVFIHHYGSQTFKANKIDYQKSIEENKKRFFAKWQFKTKKP